MTHIWWEKYLFPCEKLGLTCLYSNRSRFMSITLCLLKRQVAINMYFWKIQSRKLPPYRTPCQLVRQTAKLVPAVFLGGVRNGIQLTGMRNESLLSERPLNKNKFTGWIRFSDSPRFLIFVEKMLIFIYSIDIFYILKKLSVSCAFSESSLSQVNGAGMLEELLLQDSLVFTADCWDY